MRLDGPAIIPALLTPYAPDGSVDHGALRAHAEWLLEHGADGLMPCGSTGETALLSDDEVVAVTATAVAATGGRGPVIAHVGRPATKATAQLGARALDAGADAVSAVVPYYHPLEPEQVLDHYRALMDELGPRARARLLDPLAQQQRAGGGRAAHAGDRGPGRLQGQHDVGRAARRVHRGDARRRARGLRAVHRRGRAAAALAARPARPAACSGSPTCAPSCAPRCATPSWRATTPAPRRSRASWRAPRRRPRPSRCSSARRPSACAPRRASPTTRSCARRSAAPAGRPRP